MNSKEDETVTEPSPRASFEFARLEAMIEDQAANFRREMEGLRGLISAPEEALRRCEGAPDPQAATNGEPGAHANIDGAHLAQEIDRLNETTGLWEHRFEEADRLEVSRVNGVHGRVDVTRAEFGDAVARLIEQVGESFHRMSLVTAEVQRATDLFDLKLAALEAQTEASQQAIARWLADGKEGAPGSALSLEPGQSRNGSERDSA